MRYSNQNRQEKCRSGQFEQFEVEFADHEAVETREISENIYADLDKPGNLVSMTIKHARANVRIMSHRVEKK
ncbi:MAG: DUF2283 domain-containing protein [Syntrophobacteraceae bacterium]